MSRRAQGFGGIPLGPKAGVIGVLVLIGLVLVLNQGRFGEGHDIPAIDRPLEGLRAMPTPGRAAAGLPGAATSARTPLRFAATVDVDANRRWRQALGDRAWQDMEQPLTAQVARDLAGLPAPPGLVITYGVARVAAAEVQRQLGIREAVSAAVEDDPPARENLARRLRLQAICLAGVYVGSVYGKDVLTAANVRITLDAGLVQGSRSGAEDAWLLRGARAADPRDCRAFQDSSGG